MINLQESMEAIAFQKNSNLFKELTALFADAMKIESERELQVKLGEITSITQDATGIWMEPRLVNSVAFLAPYVIRVSQPDLNALSPINQKAVERLRNYDLDNLTNVQFINGAVDMKTGKVSGFFTKIRHDFDMSRSLLDGHFEPDEVAALYLHETGHGWTNFKYLGETMTTNVILAEVVGRMDMETTVEKRFAVGLAALKLAGVDKRPNLDVDSSEITALVLEGQVTRMQREMGTRWYDRRLAEMLADQFAARWMIGSSLARALAKLERKKGIFAEAGYDPKWIGLAVNFINFASLPFTSIAKGAATLIVESIANIAKSFAWSFGLNALIACLGPSSYNDVVDRAKAQRRELVTLLKDRQLPKEIIDTALADIKVIDEDLDKVHPFSDVFGKISRYVIGVFNGDNKMANSLAVEDLANNRLYELSASLKG